MHLPVDIERFSSCKLPETISWATMGEGKPMTFAQGDDWQGNLACECFAAN